MLEHFAQRMLALFHTPAIRMKALRPHLVFGPGDPHLLPRLIERGRARRLVMVGDGHNQVSLTYVDNAAAAHLDAADRLTPAAAHAGRAYFVNQTEPVRLWTWIAEVLAAAHIQAPTRRISAGAAYALGSMCEATWKLTRKSSEPPMTRFLALQLSTTHTYDLTPAHDDFGYTERVSLRAATERTLAALTAPHAV